MAHIIWHAIIIVFFFFLKWHSYFLGFVFAFVESLSPHITTPMPLPKNCWSGNEVYTPLPLHPYHSITTPEWQCSVNLHICDALQCHSGVTLQRHSNATPKDVRKYFFSNRIVEIWKSLPEWVISSADVYKFENNLDSFWKDQELLYDNHTVEISIKPVKQ